MSKIHDEKFIKFIGQIAGPIKLKEELPLFLITVNRQGYLFIYPSDGTSQDAILEIMRKYSVKGTRETDNGIMLLN